MIDIDYDPTMENFLLKTFAISSKDFQRRVWIQGIGPECDDFDENVIVFFQYSEWLLQEPDKYRLNSNQVKLIKRLVEKYAAFCDKSDLDLDYYMPERFIDFPEWTEITEIAKKVIDSFNYKYDYAEIQKRFREKNERKRE
jgi:hypothetical protein